MSQAISIGKKIYQIPILGFWINLYLLLEDDGSVTLVDCGLEFAPKRIENALKSIDKKMQDIQNVIFTHSHIDHVGGAATVIEKGKPVKVFSHEIEKPYLESGISPAQDFSHFAGKFMKRMPESKFGAFIVTDTVTDGQLLPIAGGLQVIHTPGHTPGHISLLHKESSVLITGDSIFNYGFKRSWAISAFCTNFKQSKETAMKFLDLDFTTAAFTHGPLIADKGKIRLKKFLHKSG